ncbi:MAG: DNA polymerase III subunit gamma/tau [Lachnospiraceae bacterium]|nr:DNA polymerase III subunit gamma/tau [Lachnospiraceae bacterium]
MSYMALYRKFRPQTFEQVKGQDHVVRTLKNQIKNNRIGHAYLFTGTRGTGKTSVAKLFAKAINCLDPRDGEPCNCCEVCLATQKDSFMDIVEIDAASNTGVDDVRRIIEEVRYTPVKGRYKVYIIDEAHMLSASAFNAFLKTLEEPPSYAVFILATTEPHKLPITILSRCQRYDFHRIDTPTIAANLKALTEQEGVEAEEKALAYIARVGDGSMRDSISLLDKCIAFSLGEKLTYENVLQTLGVVDTEIFSRVFRAVLNSDASSALRELEGAVDEGKDLSQFISDFVWYLRNLLLVNAGGSSCEDLLGVSEENLKKLKEDANIANAPTLMRYIRILSELLGELRFSMTKQILAEVAFIKLAKPQMETDNASLADRIRQLESGISSGQFAAAPVRTADESVIITQETPEEDSIFDFIPVSEEPAAMPEPETKSSSAGSVCTYWGDLLSACRSMFLKMALKNSEPVEDENGVTIYASEGINLERIKSSTGEVEALIEQITGQKKNVAVRPLSEKGNRSSAPGAFPDELLRNINFEIGTEEK